MRGSFAIGHAQHPLHRFEVHLSNIRIIPSPISIIGETLSEEAQIACTLGPSGALLDEKKTDVLTRTAIREAVEASLKIFETAHGVLSPATVYLVTADR